MNDTVGTLIAKRYSDPACQIGVILGALGTRCAHVPRAIERLAWCVRPLTDVCVRPTGTGTNACYVERASNVDRWHRDDGIIVINTEWGGFGSGGGTKMLPVRHSRTCDCARSPVAHVRHCMHPADHPHRRRAGRRVCPADVAAVREDDLGRIPGRDGAPVPCAHRERRRVVGRQHQAG